MPFLQDQLGRSVLLSSIPRRIISLVPSQTELLYTLGLDAEVVGITKFCIHPRHWFSTKTRVGGTKQLHLDKIKALFPDLILANKEENVKEQIEALEKEYPVWVSDVNNLKDALQMITSIGQLIGREEAASKLVSEIKNRFNELQPPVLSIYVNTCYLIWREPYMTIGGDTFINDILCRAGFRNIFAGTTRYPMIHIDKLIDLPCHLILLSSEPYSFRQKHIEELKEQYVKANKPVPKMLLVDGELFSWYGSRLLHTPAYINKLHQQVNAL